MMNGIDVSRWQGNIDFNKVKESGIDFVIIKAGGSDDGFYTDGQFEVYYRNAVAAGLHVGAYYFVGPNCYGEVSGIADASRFIKILGDRKFDMPVYIDFEAPSPDTRIANTNAVIAFCQTMEKHGYYCGVYASDCSGFVNRLECDRLNDFDKWVAIYGGKPSRVGSYGMWQHTDSGKVAGISGNVDCDIAYKDYPSIIVQNGFNNYPKPEKKEDAVVEETKVLMIERSKYDALLLDNDILKTENKKLKEQITKMKDAADELHQTVIDILK